MSWSHVRTDRSLAVGNDTVKPMGWFDKPEPIYYKVDNFADQHTIFLVVIVHIIYITGIPGNIVTLIVLQKKSLNDNFVSVFLSTMCVVDLWCLVAGFSAYYWMAVTAGYDFREKSYSVCLFHWLVTLIGLQVTEWMIVLISACRIHVIITRTSRKRRSDTLATAVMMVVAVLAVTLVPGYFMVKDSLIVTYKNGDIVECEVTLVADLRYIYFLLTLFLPPIVIIAENAAMHYYYRKSMPHNMRLRPANIAANQRMKMLIIMTDIMFFVTSIPPLLFHEVSRNYFRPEDEFAAVSRKFELVLIFSVLYGGFATNIVIYCCFGRRFRSELKLLLLKPAHRLGFCKEIHVRESGSIRNTEPIPFSVYTSSNQSDLTGQNTPNPNDVKPNIDQDSEQDDQEPLPSTINFEQIDKKGVDRSDQTAKTLTQYRQEDIDFQLSPNSSAKH